MKLKLFNHTLQWPDILFMAVLGLNLILVVAHFAMFDTYWHMNFNLGREENIPTFWSAFQLGLIGLAFLLWALFQLRTWRWWMMSFLVIPLYLIYDEWSGVHDNSDLKWAEFTPFWDFQASCLNCHAGYNWLNLAPFIVAFVAMGLFALRKFLPTGDHFKLLIIGCVVYLAGFLGMEFVEVLGWHYFSTSDWHHISVGIEEGLELLGQSLILWYWMKMISRERRARVIQPALRTEAPSFTRRPITDAPPFVDKPALGNTVMMSYHHRHD